MRIRRSLTLVLPVALLATGGCLATRSDIERLELAVRAMEDSSRVRQARTESTSRAAIAQAAQMLAQQFTREFAAVSDSVRQVAASLQRLQGDVQLAMHDVKGQLTTLQEGLGQSARSLQNLRTSVEASAGSQPPRAADPVAPGGAAPGGVAPGTPPAATLFQTGRQQLMRSATGSARMNFQLLIDQYPASEMAADAQKEIANSWQAEGNRAAADSVFALVVQKYPNSDAAPTALYKRAMLANDLKDSTRARAFFEQIVAKYPKSNERTLADDFLNQLKKP